jgi:diguanylate cyclase (GGDEF)-like protein
VLEGLVKPVAHLLQEAVEPPGLLELATPLLDAAPQVVEQLLGLLRNRPLALSSGLELQVTATAGLACTAQDGQTVQALLQRADERLYEGKRGGRDRLPP